MRLHSKFYQERCVSWMVIHSINSGLMYYNGAGWYKRRTLRAMQAMGIRRFDQVTGVITGRAVENGT